MSKDLGQFERMQCSPETQELALSLCRQAKLKTGPGSGRNIGQYTNALLPICALIASEQLNNNEVTFDVARNAASLASADFKKVEKIVRAALGDNAQSKKNESYTSLLDEYVQHPLLKERLEEFCAEAADGLVELGTKNIGTKLMVCSIFYWVCAAAKLSNLPGVEDFGRKHSVRAQEVTKNNSNFTRRLPELRKRISDEMKPLLASQASSPSKRGLNPTATPSTPRRSGRNQPKRELLTKESVKKQATAASPPKASTSRLPEPHEDDTEDSDDDDGHPETPTKRRRIDNTPGARASGTKLFHDTVTSPRTTRAMPQTPKKNAASRPGSPLKQAYKPPQPEDVVMDEPEETEEDDEFYADPMSRLVRRFRPVYVDDRQWSSRDRKVTQLINAGKAKADEYFQRHGNPFTVTYSLPREPYWVVFAPEGGYGETFAFLGPRACCNTFARLFASPLSLIATMSTQPDRPTQSNIPSSTRHVYLPLSAAKKCSNHLCGKDGDRFRLCTSCGEAAYCSTECQQRDWLNHKNWCGKTEGNDRIELEKFYPVIASLMEAHRHLEGRPEHPALTHTILNPPNDGPNTLATCTLPDGSSAAVAILGSPFPPTAGPLEMWWPTASSNAIREKVYRRFAREGHLLPSIVAVLVALLDSMYTTTYVSARTAPDGRLKRRVRLQYHGAPIADFGVVKGSFRANAQDQFAYCYMGDERHRFFRVMDPNEHYWIYFTTLAGQEVFLDCGLFAYNVCTVVDARAFFNHPMVAPAYSEIGDVKKRTPSLHQVRRRFSVLRDASLGDAVGLEGREKLAVINRFMEGVKGRPCSPVEKKLAGMWYSKSFPAMSANISTRQYLQYPDQPKMGIDFDPNEDNVPQEVIEKYYQEAGKGLSRKQRKGAMTTEQFADAFNRWKEINVSAHHGH